MPIRSASFKKRLTDNGKALHRAMAARTTGGAGNAPSEAETALIEERKQLKEQRAERRAKALQPGPTALDKLVRTRRAEAKDKDKPKVSAEAQDTKETKKPKATKTRAEKQAEKSAALDAARKTSKKPATK